MVWILGVLVLTGYNFTFWVIVGLIRVASERIFPKVNPVAGTIKNSITINDIAAVIPAHNEELSITRTITALLRILPQHRIYVASDFSTDRTLEIVHKLGVRALDIRPNRGKAKSLVAIMHEYKLLDAYKAIIINDADSEIDENYVKLALPYFNDKKVACIAPHGVARWRKYGFWEEFFVAYRIRLWRIVQLGMRYGQTWKFTNVSYIVPGSLSFYRTSVLRQLEIDAPGLVIEDFNMTFEVHKKKLGKIAYNPKIIGVHQDPYSLRDYIKQTQRWNVGFWQTVKRHGIWPSFFWLSTGSFLIEYLLYTLFMVLVPTIFVLYIFSSFQPLDIPFISPHLTFSDFLIGIFAADYLTTIIVAIAEKKPIILLYGLGFIFLRILDSIVYLGSIPVAFLTKSDGTWKSPVRKEALA